MNKKNTAASAVPETAAASAAPETSAAPVAPRSGGLYARVKMSVRSANIMVAVLIAVLLIATIFVVRHNGFTVKFETDGGSHIDSVKVLHSKTVPAVEDPVKEGWQFVGWYTDRDCTRAWNISTDTVETSMTLYAKWQRRAAG